MWSFLIWGVLSLSWFQIQLTTVKENSGNFSFGNSGEYIAAHFVIMLMVFSIGTPLTGWLADVYLGRYKVMQGSLVLMLVGLITHSIVDLTFIYGIPSTEGYTARTDCLMFLYLIGSLLQWLGAGGFLSNAIQFGIDQMSDPPSSEISAFVFWYVFVINSGSWTATFLTKVVRACSLSRDVSMSVVMIFPIVCVSVVLCSNFLFQHLLISEPQTQNPLKLIVRVLKYTATHSKIRVRSAFTYLDTPPSRLDVGKSKFGGPFTTEQVEDVKTFMRILLLMCPLSLLIVTFSQIQLSLRSIKSHLRGYDHSCDITYIAALFYDHKVLIALYIVFYEVMIYPFLRKRILSMLRRISVSAIFLCLLIVTLLLVDTIGHATSPGVPCMFDHTKSNATVTFDIPLYAVEIPANILLALVLVLLNTATYEFICAQSPYSMRAIFIGFAWSTYIISFGIGDLITLIWTKSNLVLDRNFFSCGLLFYLSILFIALLGLLLYGAAACCYKMRVRDEIHNERAIIEEVYSRRCSMENSINNINIINQQHPILCSYSKQNLVASE